MKHTKHRAFQSQTEVWTEKRPVAFRDTFRYSSTKHEGKFRNCFQQILNTHLVKVRIRYFVRLRTLTVTHKAAAEHPFKIRHLTKTFLLSFKIKQSSPPLLAVVPSSLDHFIQSTDRNDIKRSR